MAPFHDVAGKDLVNDLDCRSMLERYYRDIAKNAAGYFAKEVG